MRPDQPATPESDLAGEADVGAIGALVADPARCAILLALDDGRALPASRLADQAAITPATASSHLRKLTDAGLLDVDARGRYRYYRLSGLAAGNVTGVNS
jgi:DNA-binding transcriptional ArsR family regulator